MNEQETASIQHVESRIDRIEDNVSKLAESVDQLVKATAPKGLKYYAAQLGGVFFSAVAMVYGSYTFVVTAHVDPLLVKLDQHEAEIERRWQIMMDQQFAAGRVDAAIERLAATQTILLEKEISD